MNICMNAYTCIDCTVHTDMLFMQMNRKKTLHEKVTRSRRNILAPVKYGFEEQWYVYTTSFGPMLSARIDYCALIIIITVRTVVQTVLTAEWCQNGDMRNRS